MEVWRLTPDAFTSNLRRSNHASACLPTPCGRRLPWPPLGGHGFIWATNCRSKSKNLRVSHSIFTQKFSATPNYERLVELPTFGHSDNHAGLQICDIVCSGLLYPIACYAYCAGHVNNVHVQSGASRLRTRYGRQLKELQHRYYDVEKRRHVGGVVVSDYLDQRSGALMFGS